MGYKLDCDGLNQFLLNLKSEYEIYAPKRFVGKGRFSDTDLIKYDRINKASEIVWNEKSDCSPKEIIFPINQTLFYFTEDEFRESGYSKKKKLVFLRPCDINGIERLDLIFLNNGNYKDSYYQRLRANIKFVMIECCDGFENCFCVSMDSNKTNKYDLAIRVSDKNIFLDIKDNSFSKHIPLNSNVSDFIPEFIRTNTEVVKVPDDMSVKVRDIHDSSFWDEYKDRCIGCGRCNTTCITCSCHSTKDIFYDDNHNVGERRRVWSSCQIDGFSEMAGGMSYRKDHGQRMRFKTMHKIYDFKKKFGKHMCVGCGRCDDNCPEYISFSNCINKLNNL